MLFNAIFTTIFLYLGVGVAVRTMAKFHFLFIVPKAFMVGFVTRFKNNVVDLTAGVGTGGITDIVHGIPGYRVNRNGSDLASWSIIPGVERRGLLYYLYGVEYIGFFRYLAKIKVKTVRLVSTPAGTDTYETKLTESDFVFFSGEHTVMITDADTAGSYQLDFVINLIWELTYPVRAQFTVADSIAQLNTAVDEKTNQVSGVQLPENFLGNSDGPDPVDTALVKADLINKIVLMSATTQQDFGVSIRSARLVSVTADAATEQVLQLAAKRKRENAAKIKDAEADKTARILANDAEADRIDRTIIKIADNPGAVRLKLGENLERSKITTIAGDALSLILNGTSGPAVTPNVQPAPGTQQTP